MSIPILYAGSLHNESGVLVPIPEPPPQTTLLLDLEADQLALSDGDPVSTWADQSGNGNNFIGASGTERHYHTTGGTPYVDGNGNDPQFLTGPNFVDNLESFTVMLAIKSMGWGGSLINKLYYDGLSTTIGWDIYSNGDGGTVQFYASRDTSSEDRNGLSITSEGNVSGSSIITVEKISNTAAHIYLNGVLNDGAFSLNGTLITFSNSEPVRIGVAGGPAGDEYAGYSPHQGYAYIIHPSVLSPTARAAAEVELAARYGITL